MAAISYAVASELHMPIFNAVINKPDLSSNITSYILEYTGEISLSEGFVEFGENSFDWESYYGVYITSLTVYWTVFGGFEF